MTWRLQNLTVVCFVLVDLCDSLRTGKWPQGHDGKSQNYFWYHMIIWQKTILPIRKIASKAFHSVFDRQEIVKLWTMSMVSSCLLSTRIPSRNSTSPTHHVRSKKFHCTQFIESRNTQGWHHTAIRLGMLTSIDNWFSVFWSIYIWKSGKFFNFSKI